MRSGDAEDVEARFLRAASPDLREMANAARTGAGHGAFQDRGTEESWREAQRLLGLAERMSIGLTSQRNSAIRRPNRGHIRTDLNRGNEDAPKKPGNKPAEEAAGQGRRRPRSTCCQDGREAKPKPRKAPQAVAKAGREAAAKSSKPHPKRR